MTKAFPLAIVAFGLFTPSAWAVDWNIKSTLSESVEINDNRKLQVNPAGNSYNSISSLLFDALALTPTSRFSVNGNLKYRAYAGPGEVGTLNALDNGVTARLEKSQKLTTYNVMASRNEVETSSLQLEETGFATLSGSTITTTVGGGFKHELGPRDSISSSTNYTTTEFTAPGATPLASLTSTVSFVHKLSPITNLMPSLQFQRLNFDNAAQTEITFWTAMMGMKTELSKRLSFTGAVGGASLNSQQNSITAANPAGLTSGGSGLDWLANMQLTYKPVTTVSVSLTAAQTIGPTTFGQFLKSDTAGLALGYTINQASGVTVSGTFTRTTPATGSPYDLISAGVSYSYRVAREWRTALSYRYTQRNSDTDSARSNSVNFVLTHDVTILP